MPPPTAAECADELLALIQNELDESSTVVGRRIIMGALDRFCAEHVDTPARRTEQPAAPRRPPFTHAEASHFEHRLLPEKFHRHANKSVGDTPLDYLDRLTRPDPFVVEIDQYLRSDRGKRRIEDGE